MSIYEHARHFAGRPVRDWSSESEYDPARICYRLRLSWEEFDTGAHWTDKFAAFLEQPGVEQSDCLVVGLWHFEGGASDRVVEALVSARQRLPRLRALFLGDIVSEESEISWINQGDVSPLLNAYPDLEHFRVRGGMGLQLGALRHNHLKSLIIESGGLPANVVREVAEATLPELEHLELWLGTEHYGGDARVEDLAGILSGQRFPNLYYLGLRDSDIADQIAAAIVEAPILDRIRVLDLSMGTLGDEGAAALLHSPAVAKLEFLDIHHHYCSPHMVEQLGKVGTKVDSGDPQEPYQWDDHQSRYVAVGE